MGRPSGAAHASFLGVRWLSTDVVDGDSRARDAWWGEVLPRAQRRPPAPTSSPTAPVPMTTTWPRAAASPRGIVAAPRTAVEQRPARWTGTTYERWVAGYDVETGRPKGRLRDDANALRFVEVIVNGPKTWSLAAALHPRSRPPTTRRRTGPPSEIIGWVAEHATTRVGPRGRQVQVPVEQIEAAVVRHYTSRAGDPHRHLHLQINARVFAAGAWRGLHSVGVRDSIEAINGIGHAAVPRDPEFRAALAAHGFTLDPETGEVAELAPYVGAFSARAAQIGRNIDRYEAEWRTRAPRPGARAAAAARRGTGGRGPRPDPTRSSPPTAPSSSPRWIEELHDLGYHDPPHSPPPTGARPRPGRLARPRRSSPTVVLTRLGARRSAWNAADIRGEVEQLDRRRRPRRRRRGPDRAGRGPHRPRRRPLRAAAGPRRRARARPRPDLAAGARGRGRPRRPASPPRRTQPADRTRCPGAVAGPARPDAKRGVVAALAGDGRLLVVEGAAGAGKTTTLAAARRPARHAAARRLVVVTPTLKAAQVAAAEIGADAFSAAWLVHQHGFRWDDDGHWTRDRPRTPTPGRPAAARRPAAGRRGRDARPGHRPRPAHHRRRGRRPDRAGRRPAPAPRRRPRRRPRPRRPLGPPAAPSRPRHRAPVHRPRVRRPHPARCAPASDAGEVFDALHRARPDRHPPHRGRTHRRPRRASAPPRRRPRHRRHPRAGRRAQRRHPRPAARRRSADPTRSARRVRHRARRADRRRRPGRHPTQRPRPRRRQPRHLDRHRHRRTTAACTGHAAAPARRGRSPPAYVHEHVELAYATTVYGAQGETVDRAHLARRRDHRRRRGLRRR